MIARHLDAEFFERLEHLRTCGFCRTQVIVYERFLALLREIYGVEGE
jgi:hypothetical protein